MVLSGTVLVDDLQLQKHSWTRRSAVAKNTGSSSRRGSISDRFQLLDPESGLWSVFKPSSGSILRTKKSPGPAKGIRVGPPKKSGGRS